MESRFEEMTKEQLIAELNVSEQIVKTLRKRVDEYEQDEKKREFERRLAEATNFLKANGYEVRQMSAAERFPGNEMSISDIACKSSLPWTISGGPLSEIHLESPKTRVIRAGVELKWADEDMLNFALQWYPGTPIYSKNVRAVFESFVKSHQP